MNGLTAAICLGLAAGGGLLSIISWVTITELNVYGYKKVNSKHAHASLARWNITLADESYGVMILEGPTFRVVRRGWRMHLLVKKLLKGKISSRELIDMSTYPYTKLTY